VRCLCQFLCGPSRVQLMFSAKVCACSQTRVSVVAQAEPALRSYGVLLMHQHMLHTCADVLLLTLTELQLQCCGPAVFLALLFISRHVFVLLAGATRHLLAPSGVLARGERKRETGSKGHDTHSHTRLALPSICRPLNTRSVSAGWSLVSASCCCCTSWLGA
jgi:hypothetical protein